MIATPKSCWEIDIRPSITETLLSWCLVQQRTDRMLVVVRTERQKRTEQFRTSGEVQRQTETLFAKYILESFLASAWPGTELMDHPARVYVIEFGEATKDIIVNTEPDLRNWLHNRSRPLPEDLCLFSMKSSSPTLVSVTHEGLFWLLADKAPKLDGKRKAKLNPQELFWTGKYFCTPWSEKKG